MEHYRIFSFILQNPDGRALKRSINIEVLIYDSTLKANFNSLT